MERVLIVTDDTTDQLFAFVTERDGVLKFHGVDTPGKEWAEWVESQKEPVKALDGIVDLLDYDFSVEGPKAMSASVRNRLGEHLQPENAPTDPEGGVTEEKAAGRGDAAHWRARINYKAMAFTNDMYLSTMAYEVKRTRATRVPDIGNGKPGWICPPGTRYGGRFTDRFGTNCGWSVSRRLTNAIGDTARVGRTSDNARVRRASTRVSRVANRVERGMDAATSRRLARRDARTERRISARGNRRRKPSETLNDFADRIDGGYGKRKRGQGKPRKRTGTDPKKPKISERLNNFADRMDGGRGRRPGRQRRGTAPKKSPLSERLNRFADRMDGGAGRKRREERRKRRAERRANRKPVSQRLNEFADRITGGYSRRENRRNRRASGKKPVSQRLNDFADRMDGGSGRSRRRGAVTETARKRPAGKPKKINQEFDFEPKTEFEKRLREMDDDEIIDRLRKPADNKPTDGTFGYNPQSDKEINDAVKREARRRGLTAGSKKTGKKKPKPEAATPTPTKKPEGKKPSGPANKKLPGKRYGGTFTKEDGAKASAINAALNTGETMYVVKTGNGKYQIVDGERLAAMDDDAVMAIGPNGDVIDLPGLAADNGDVVDDVTEALEDLADDAEEDLKDLKVPAGVTELTRSKTGQFLPDNLDEVLEGDRREQFLKAWADQQDEVAAWWGSRFADDNPFVDGDGNRVDVKDLDLERILEKVDGIIATEQGKDQPNEGKLGVYRAERANFLALFAPDAGKDEVNPAERFNLVQPKRRGAIIEDAELEDLVVSGKKVKKKKVTADVNGEASPADNAPEADAPEADAPEGDAPEGDVTEEQPTNEPPAPTKPPFDPNSSDSQLKAAEAADEAIAEMDVTELEDEVKKYLKEDGSVDEKKLQDTYSDLLAKVKKAEDDDDEAAGMEALKDLKVLTDHVTPAIYEEQAAKTPDLDDPNDPDLLEVKKQQAQQVADEIFEAEADNPTHALMVAGDFDNYFDEFLAEGVTGDELDKEISTLNKFIDTSEKYWKEQLEQTIAAGNTPSEQVVVNALIRPGRQREALANRTAKYLTDLQDGDTKKAIDDIVKTGKKSPAQRKAAKDWAVEALNVNDVDENSSDEDIDAALNTALDVITQNQEDAIDRVNASVTAGDAPDEQDVLDAYVFPDKARRAVKALAKKYKANINAEDTENTPTPEISDTEVDGPDGDTSFSGINAAFDVPDFNAQQLIDYEAGKSGTSLDMMQSRAAKHGALYDSVMAKLPDNFDELPEDEQRAAIREAVGVSTDLEAAKRLGRSAAAGRYGDGGSLFNLRLTSDMLASDDIAAKVAYLDGSSERDLDEELSFVQQDLANAAEARAALSVNAHPLVVMAAEGKVATAQNRMAEIAALRYLRAASDPENNDVLNAAKDLSVAINNLPSPTRDVVAKAVVGNFEVKAGNVGSLIAKGIAKPDFDSTTLGSVQDDGKAIAYSVPLGNKGIWSAEDARSALATGQPLSDVPDALLKDAIWENTGEGKRFRTLNDGSIKGGWNDHGQDVKDQTTGFVDTLTGKKYVIKTAHRNEQEHTQEIAAARVAQILGHPTTGIRLGSEILEKDLPSHKAQLEGKDKGLQRAIVMEHVGNLFGEGYEVIGPISKLSATDEIDGDSLARLMVLDRTVNYFDRTQTNLIAVRRPDGLIHLHPIDHGNAFYDFQGGTAAEQAAGFTKLTKGDNIDLMAMASNLSPEQKQRFAEAMVDAVKRTKRTKWDVTLADVGKRQNLSDAERQRLDKHGEWLNQRLKDLDFDAMTTDALTRLGIPEEQIQDLYSGGAKAFQVETGVATFESAAQEVDDLPIRNVGITVMYDGGAIEGFAATTQPINIKGLPDATKAKPGTQITFRLNLAEVDPAALVQEEGWEPFGKDIAVSGAPKTRANIDVSDPTKNKTVPNSGVKGTTYRKVLPDGTYAFVTVNSSNPKNAAHGRVHLVIPDNPKTVLADGDRIAAAMEAVKVTQHGQPSPEQVQEVGMRRLGNQILGPQVAAGKSLDEIEELLAAKGFSPEDVILGKDTDGKPSIRLTVDATRRLAQQMGNTTNIYHSIGYGTTPQGRATRVVELMTQGAIASTIRRYDHGVNVQGMSSPQDVNYGSGNHTFNKIGTAGSIYTITGEVNGWAWYGLPELTLSRLDSYVTKSDAFGDFTSRVPHTEITNQQSAEHMIESSVRVAAGVMVVPDFEYDGVITEIKSRGVEEVDGIPIESLVVKRSEAKEKFDALRSLWETRGFHE